MNSLPEAFSFTLGRIVTLGQALQMAANGIDVTSGGFCCPGENCRAHVALVGFEKAKEIRKKQVHFRSYHHVDGCTYVTYLRQRPKDFGLTQPVHADSDTRVAPDRFTPDSDNENFESPEPTVADAPVKLIPANFTGFQVSTDRTMAFGQLHKLVLRFRQFQRSGLLDDREIIIGDRTFKYAELFQYISRQDSLGFQDSARVWYGTARVRLHGEGRTFSVNFDGTLGWDREIIHPVFFLRESWTRFQPPYPATQRKLLDQARERSVNCMIYCLTKPSRWSEGEKRAINLIPTLRSEFWFEPALKTTESAAKR